MKVADYLEDLDPELSANLERALATLRDEFEQKVGETVRETVAASAPPEPVAAAPSAPAEQPQLALDASDELRLAAMEIDIVSSQSEVLEALSRGALRFASRVAVFVHRGDELHGWSASGFGAADTSIKDTRLSASSAPVADVLGGKGSVGLAAQDCTEICDAIGAETPSVGLLMPFVLGNQVVGTIYCDRVGEGAFSVSALQLLTYMAGQTLETLPVRKRDSTATLSLFGSATGVEEAPVADVAPEPVAEPAVTEPEVSEPEAIEPEPDSGPEDEASEFDAPTEDDSLAAMVAPAPIETPEIESPAETMQEAPGEGFGADSLPAIESSPALAGFEAPTPVAEPSPEPEPETDVAAATEPAVSLSSTEVAPPDDLQGPGWAFNATGGPVEATSESDHEEAQRLARLLVTEIKLYNEEAVEEGRRNGNVYALLTEDIDRSRQIFEDRIDDEVRGENDYFKQALVRILAGGDPSLLGM